MVSGILLFISTSVLCLSTQGFLILMRQRMSFVADRFSRRAQRIARGYAKMALGLVMLVSLSVTIFGFYQTLTDSAQVEPASFFLIHWLK